MKKKPGRWYRWEIALACGVVLSVLLGTWLNGQQRALAEQVIRLHVIGASDSAEDQLNKLRVRDAVLGEAEPLLEGILNQEAAQRELALHLKELEEAGRAALGGRAVVTASLEDDAWFPTKRYPDFALPAGRYPALRITVGEGRGRNWWCVVFPPLCLESVAETVEERAACMAPEQISLITGENEGYVVRFKVLELWNSMREKISAKGSRDR